MKRWTVVLLMVMAGVALHATDASAYWRYQISGRAASQGIYMWQAGCGSDGCEHHDCSEGVCFHRWGDYGDRGSGKVGEIACGQGPYESVWCGIVPHSCQQPEPYRFASFTDAYSFWTGDGTRDSGVLACAVGRCNGPDTAPDCGATSGGCTDRYWRYGGTCGNGSCWGLYCSGSCGTVSWSAWWYN